jgi:uncharacterized membrane protein YphA (DoxX/SURF4 family)
MINKIITMFDNPNISKYGPVVARFGLALVFLWFGFTQVTGPESWTSLIPEFITNITHLSALTFVYINGGMEIILGILLILGIYTRISALILALHLLVITIDVGYNAIGIRDFGLTMATFSIFLNGPDFLALEKRSNKNI